jgi:hypothetical protein
MTRTCSILAGATLLVTAIAAAPVAAQTCVDAPAGLVGWWSGDGDARDLRSGLDATLMGGAGFAPGLVGQAFRLDGLGNGQDDRLELPPAALNGRTDVSVEMWVLTEDSDAAILSAANGDPGVGDNEVLLYQGTAGLLQIVKQQSSGALPSDLADGVWHHVTFTREGDMGRLFVDGVLIDARAFPAGPLQVASGGLLLGQEQDCLAGCFDPNQAFDGLIDELSIYDRALSEAEVLALFEAGEAGKCKPPSMDEVMQRLEDLEADVDALTERVTDLEATAGDDGNGGSGECRGSHGRHHHHDQHRHSGRR